MWRTVFLRNPPPTRHEYHPPPAPPPLRRPPSHHTETYFPNQYNGGDDGGYGGPSPGTTGTGFDPHPAFPRNPVYEPSGPEVIPPVFQEHKKQPGRKPVPEIYDGGGIYGPEDEGEGYSFRCARFR